ncbi:hypothetical protein HZB03_03910 [Candidatus Woesearchaeota archaeon]|nr:hypothetical protein [Candidatus Woesearchaeota archaeon]
MLQGGVGAKFHCFAAVTLTATAFSREMDNYSFTPTSWTPPAAIDPLALDLKSDFRFASIGRRTLSSIERSEILRCGLIREALPYGEGTSGGMSAILIYCRHHELGVVVQASLSSQPSVGAPQACPLLR